MDQEFPVLIEEVVTSYRRYWTALLQRAEPLWSQLDLTILQLKGLILLEARDELTVGGIATALGIGRPSASILVEQLVQLGLATRAEDSSDRRRSLVCLTTEGRDLAAKLHRGDEQHMQRVFERMCTAELLALKKGLEAITDVFLDAR